MEVLIDNWLKQRDNNIINRLKDCIFIKYNPYDYKFDKLELFNKIHREILYQTKNKINIHQTNIYPIII